jgi:hypothetical protein
VSSRFWWYLALGASTGIYAGFAASFFPYPPGRLGHDYEYFLPLVLAGEYWVAANGVFVLPHFSPAFCGGLPFLANPQSIFYSVPQAFSLFVDPETSFLLTTILFAALGGIGTFALMHVRFQVSLPAACVSAVLFMFNSFLLTRMVVGHVTYHAVGLTPLLCHLLLTPIAKGRDRLPRTIGAMCLGGAIIAYFVYAGAANIVVPLAVCVLAVWLMYGLARKTASSFWFLGMGSAVLGSGLAAAKLVPAMAFISHFPRPEPLTLLPDLGSALLLLIPGLVLPSMLPDFARRELDYGVGPVPFLLIAIAASVVIGRGAALHCPRPAACAKISALFLLLAIPLGLNIGGHDFAVWLKTVPYIGQNVLLVRWFFVYLLPLVIGAGLALDYAFSENRLRAGAALVAIAAVSVVPLVAGSNYNPQQSYDPEPVIAADHALRLSGRVPAIVAIGAGAQRQANDGLAAGTSSLPCYEPMFGYQLQSFPPGLIAGRLAHSERHLRNPACYVYGQENDCAPGDGFGPDAADQEASFAAYRPFAYREPWWGRVARMISMASLAAIVAGFGLALFRLIGGRFSGTLMNSEVTDPQ